MKIYEIEKIKDKDVRENFQKLLEELRAFPLFQGQFRFIELSFDGAVTDKSIQHHLGFQPRDVIQSSLTGTGVIVFKNDLFSPTHIVVSTTDACVFRGFIGAYVEGT